MRSFHNAKNVSILVLLDNGLRHYLKEIVEEKNLTESQSLFYWTMGYDMIILVFDSGKLYVSILVLLDNGLRPPKKLTSQGKPWQSLNPCFIGQWATTAPVEFKKMLQHQPSQSLFYWTMGYDWYTVTVYQQKEKSQSLFYWTMGYDARLLPL